MASDQRGGASPPGRQCGRCGAPLPDRRTWTCMLNEGCCPACFARCEAGKHSGFGIVNQVPAGNGRYLIVDNDDHYVYVVDIAAVPMRVAHVFDMFIWAWSGDGRSVCYDATLEGKTLVPPRGLSARRVSIDNIEGDFFVSHEMDKMVEMPLAAPHDTPPVSPLPPPACRFTPLVGEMHLGARGTKHVAERVHPHSFSPDGRWLATTYGDKMCIRDTRRGSVSSVSLVSSP